MEPAVSFVVPCYKLGHLLSECIHSILEQTYTNFEILVMDDCSPDNTPEVAQSFSDPRVKHVRNDPNLGHLRNYNKGIGMARGRYIWLISADDRLRRANVLQRYVDIMDRHPDIGYSFCPAVDLCNGQETRVLEYSLYGSTDKIMNGPQFVKKLIRKNFIVAPSVLARKECYDRDLFPLDMPWGGDWYLWLVFALHSNVAYFAEPMVCYRRHQQSMTNLLMHHDLDACSSDDIRIPWIVKEKTESLHDRSLVKACLGAIAEEYARSMVSQRYRTSSSCMTLDEFRQSLSDHSTDAGERRWIEARTYVAMADRYCWQEDYLSARLYYLRAIQKDMTIGKAWIRFLVLSTGTFGIRLRKVLLSFRQSVSGSKSGV